MISDIRNYPQIKELIINNPKSAEAQASEWRQFLKTNAQSSPELYSIESPGEFYKWASEKHINPSVWVGKEISEAYYDLREEHEASQMIKDGVIDHTKMPTELAAVPLLAAAFLQKPKIMEDDANYQKIEAGLKKEWLKNNNAKDFSSKEGVDYLYGSLDDKTKTSLGKEAEKAFRDNPKYQKRVERYDKEAKKIYKKQEDDPKWMAYKTRAQQEVAARIELLEKRLKYSTSLKISKTELEKYKMDINTRVNDKIRSEFIQKNPKKAAAYFKTYESAVNKNNPSPSVVFSGNPVPQTNQFFATNIPHPAEKIAGSFFTTDNFSGGSNTFLNTNAPPSMEGAGQYPSSGNLPGIPSLPTKTMPGAKIGNPLGRLGLGNTMQTIRAAIQNAAKGFASLVSKPTFWAAISVAITTIITYFRTLFS